MKAEIFYLSPFFGTSYAFGKKRGIPLYGKQRLSFQTRKIKKVLGKKPSGMRGLGKRDMGKAKI